MLKLFIYVIVTLCAAPAAMAAPTDAQLHGEKAISVLKQQRTYDSFNAAYTDAVYAVERGRNGGYQAWNVRQGLTARFDSEGIQVESAHGSVGLRLAGWGYGNTLTSASPREIAASGRGIEYRRGGLVEWYVNEAAGIEQGFTLSEAPAGVTPGAPLTIVLALRGPLQPELTDRGRSILLRSGTEPELRYAGLKAWDARGRNLPARMEIAGNELRILVNDAAAAFPVTIDPAFQQAELTAADGRPNDTFGQMVSVSSNTLVAGAYNKNSGTGAAYVFTRSGSTWTQQAELTASDGASGDSFGWSVYVRGDMIVAGAIGKNGRAGAAYVFVRNGTAWTQQAELTASDGASNDVFGISVAVNKDTLVAGACGKNNGTGAAYAFVRSGTSWTQQAELTASDGVSRDSFGYSVSIHGETAVVGAVAKNTSSGAAYIFARSGTAWTQQAKLTAPDGMDGDQFGLSVSIRKDTVVSGASGRNGGNGAAYVFVRNGTNWTQQAELTAPHDAGGGLGESVSLDEDTIVAGAPGRKAQTGAAYVFMRSGSVWTQHARLTAADSVSQDYFGFSVSVSRGTVVAGAPGKDSVTGAAYVFIVEP